MYQYTTKLCQWHRWCIWEGDKSHSVRISNSQSLIHPPTDWGTLLCMWNHCGKKEREPMQELVSIQLKEWVWHHDQAVTAYSRQATISAWNCNQSAINCSWLKHNGSLCLLMLHPISKLDEYIWFNNNYTTLSSITFFQNGRLKFPFPGFYHICHWCLRVFKNLLRILQLIGHDIWGHST